MSLSELLLLPFEASTSYQRGTAAGPASLFGQLDPGAFAAVRKLDADSLPAERYLELVAAQTAGIAGRGSKVAAIGGEHTVTFGILDGLCRAGRRPAVIQLDAHADLREEYEGTPWSHACVMRRVADRLDLPSLGVGIRSLSKEEAAWAGQSGRTPIYVHQLRGDLCFLTERAADLGTEVYLTVDIDVLDPSVVPGTGTPEPGGLGWYRCLEVIDMLLEGKDLVGFDLVEYSPEVEESVSLKAAQALFVHILRRL